MSATLAVLALALMTGSVLQHVHGCVPTSGACLYHGMVRMRVQALMLVAMVLLLKLVTQMQVQHSQRKQSWVQPSVSVADVRGATRPNEDRAAHVLDQRRQWRGSSSELLLLLLLLVLAHLWLVLVSVYVHVLPHVLVSVHVYDVDVDDVV